jgi:hypothetical protein
MVEAVKFKVEPLQTGLLLPMVGGAGAVGTGFTVTLVPALTQPVVVSRTVTMYVFGVTPLKVALD